MSIEALNWAKRQTVGCPGRKFVLFALADRADEVWSCFPSLALLHAETEMCERTVIRHIKALETEGWVHVERRPGKRSRYTLQPGVTPDMVSVSPLTELTPDNLSPPTQSPVTPDKNDAPIRNNPQEPTESGGLSARAMCDRLLEVAGPGLADPAKEPNLLISATTLSHWIAQGADFELDVVPVVEALTAAPKTRPIGSWKFFTEAVREHVAERLALKPIEAAETPHGYASPDDESAALDAIRRGAQRGACRIEGSPRGDLR